jgi:RNA polymerase sigma-70 factor (ECF subfamily)
VTVPAGPTPPEPEAGPPGPSAHQELSLDEAFAAYRAELTSLARRALGSSHLAEEAVQVRAWRSRHRFDPAIASMRTWLYSIERNLLVDMARSRQRQELRDLRLGEGAESIVDHVENAMVSWQVEEAVNHLSDDHRTVVVEIYFQGRTSRELADRLAIPEGTVRSRLFYALKALRLTLQEMGWAE